MTALCIAAAQTCAIAGDLAANIARHLQFMDRAAHHGVQCLLFPELSLTGYEPTLAAALAQPAATPLLQPLRDRARTLGMTTVVGLPLRESTQTEVRIGALVLHANGDQTVYTKQHLHGGEEVFFAAGIGGAPLHLGGEHIALAVCADFTRPEHARLAREAGATVYAASVLIGEAGYPADSHILQGYARTHGMAVLLANHGGPTGGWQAAGRSALWDAQGRLVVAVNGAGEQLLVARRTGEGWQARVEGLVAEGGADAA
ncbi:carbon-nitrogen hydrolase family protein [Pseudomonas eucalypticola]|uniref:Carbon-nitrogen hydrolase family protein n=1 Tax=Pseudomonas eucalypticola TaxID=2599595 RepID=A0A7D5D9T2_9PSED|nr:carbon-nitrogen hydrolase family protein [Pseudomonas eucalypticola]QKZ05515.1 carbon-nitrogen hydrolase family protein [Pseudomonas eucalypticola]